MRAPLYSILSYHTKTTVAYPPHVDQHVMHVLHKSVRVFPMSSWLFPSAALLWQTMHITLQ